MEQKNETKRAIGHVWIFFLLLLIILGIYLLMRTDGGIRDSAAEGSKRTDNALEVPE